MSKRSLDDIITLDDSTHLIRPFFNSEPLIHIYSHYLFDPKEKNEEYLIFVSFLIHFFETKDSYEKGLVKFVSEYNPGKRLFACQHYIQYPHFRGLVSEFTTKRLRKGKHRFLDKTFSVSDEGARQVGRVIEDFLKKKDHLKDLLGEIRKNSSDFESNLGGLNVFVLKPHYSLSIRNYF